MDGNWQMFILRTFNSVIIAWALKYINIYLLTDNGFHKLEWSNETSRMCYEFREMCHRNRMKALFLVGYPQPPKPRYPSLTAIVRVAICADVRYTDVFIVANVTFPSLFMSFSIHIRPIWFYLHYYEFLKHCSNLNWLQPQCSAY